MDERLHGEAREVHADAAHRMFATIVDGPSAHGKSVTGMAVWRFASYQELLK